MKILVPYDFSKSSNNAALYAVKFAKKVNAEIILLHVVHFEHPPMVQITESIDHKLEEIRISEASKNFVLLVDELKTKVQEVKISFQVIADFPVENAIEGFAKNNDITLIIMGTKGTNSFSKLMFGSTVVSLINKSSLPIISIPETSSFNDVKRIIYATDMDKNLYGILKTVAIAKLFDAQIDVLHILPLDSNKTIDIISVEKKLAEECTYQKISFHITYNDDILEGINAFVSHLKADILAMYTHNIGFFESLFKTSISRNEVFYSFVPLLTIKNESGKKSVKI